MKAQKRNIIAYINTLPAGIAESLRAYEAQAGARLRLMLIRDSRQRQKATPPACDILVRCDLSKPQKIAEALLPYQDELLAITCTGDSNVGKLAKVIPHVPYLRTPSVDSIDWTSDKLKMRRRLKLYDPKHTPRFTQVKNNTPEERARVIKRVQFPMIIKPTNLSASMLVSVCYHEEELEKTLRTTFRKLHAAYRSDRRIERPRIIAEEYMDGDMYSVDAYVKSRGGVVFCPLVRVLTGCNVGQKDFYNYLRITPTKLKKASIERAHERVSTAVHALGLKNTSVHVELMKVDDDWKIIEIAPRIGGFRHTLYKLSCGIDHLLNDVLVRIPEKVHVPKKCGGYAATFRYYPESEGVITKMQGIKVIRSLESFHSMSIKKRIGDRASFSKNGGKAVLGITLYNTSRQRLLADIRRVEEKLHIRVARARKISQYTPLAMQSTIATAR